jgi:Iap family predicted aminopeptidase
LVLLDQATEALGPCPVDVASHPEELPPELRGRCRIRLVVAVTVITHPIRV